MNPEYDKLCEIDGDIERTNKHIAEIRNLLQNRPLTQTKWVKLIPADSIPVFCLSPEVLDMDMVRIREELAEFFGARKFLVIRSGDVQIYAIADPDTEVK